jgi:two-component system sensor histidine kinase PilS (NtrC family)
MEEQNLTYSSVLNNIETGIVVLSSELEVLFINEKASIYFGKDLADNSNTFFSNILADWLKTPSISVVSSNINGYSYIIKVKQSENGEILLQVKNSKIRYKEHQQNRLLALGHIAASLAHEIRNPLQVILQAVDLVDEHNGQIKRIIKSSAEKISEILVNAFALSNNKQREPIIIALREFTKELCLNYEHASFIINIKPELKITFVKSQLEQILDNLIANSISNSLRPEIMISARENDSRILITVTDNGPGIKAEDRDKLFKPFYTTKTSGIGLGLFISRTLCELNNATIENIPYNKGCRFDITINKKDYF